MASVNKVILIGRVGKDPETRYLTNGDAVTNISIATSEVWKDKNGEKQEKTEWSNVVFYRKLAEIVGEYVKKGSQIFIEGKLETRKYTDKNGIERYATQIVADEMKMLGGGKSSSSNEEHSDQGKTKQTQQRSPNAGTGFDDMADDIPF